MATQFATAGFNAMLNALAALNTHLGAFTKGTALTSVTGVNSTDVFTKSSHGMANGTLVKISGLTGGSALSVDKWYFVIGQTTNTFQLSETSGGSAVDLGSDVSAATVTPYTEVSGGSYARQAVAYNGAALATMDDSTNGASIPIPAATTVDAIGGFSAVSAGTLYWAKDVTAEVFAGAGTYVVNDVDLSLAPA